MQKETAFIAVAALFSLLSSALAANLRYTAVDDVRSWDNVSAWKCEDGLYGSLPQPLDNVSIDSGTVALPNFLRVTNGVTAAAYTLKLGALDGDASYAQSGKIIALKVESGGVLHTGKGEFDAISIGDRASGYGIVTIEGGMVSNQFITVGTKGIGVLTNDCGTIVQLGPELGSYGYLNVGFEQSATGTVVMTGGAITHLPSSSSWNNAIINVGRCGHGTFELSGGVISNRLMVGTSRSDIPGGGTGVFRMSGGILENRLFIGYKEGQDAGSGFAEITGGTVNGHVYVGQYGSGRLVVDGGTLNIPREKRYDSMHENPFYASGLSVGRNARSNGEFVFRSGTLNFAKNSNLVVGYNGAGSAEFFAEATVPYLRVGGSSAGGRLVVHDGVTLTVSCSMQVGGYPILEDSSSDNDIVECVGTGLLVLTNATLRFLDGDDYGSFDNTSGQLSIGRYDGSYGVLRGCGMICGPDANSNNVRIWMDNGQIIADGFGKESELDLNTVISIRNNTADIASDTTNGWYAVDKGAALFPRVFSPADRSIPSLADGAEIRSRASSTASAYPSRVCMSPRVICEVVFSRPTAMMSMSIRCRRMPM